MHCSEPLARTSLITLALVTIIATVANALSSSSSPVPPLPPISVPVWSFATTTTTTSGLSQSSFGRTSMNIMTFCTPVSVSFPKLWALSFYHGTLTKDSFLGDKNGETKRGVLQLLTPDHSHLVPILGKNSGRDTNKSEACFQKGFPWWKPNDDDEDNKDLELLPGCALYVQFEVSSPQEESSSLVDAGDHVVAICKVTRTGVWAPSNDSNDDDDDASFKGGKVVWLDNNDSLPPGGMNPTNALYSGLLREEGIL